MADSPILLLDADPTAGPAIAASLTGFGHRPTLISSAEDVVRQAADHQLVVVDVVTGDEDAPTLARRLRATPEMAGIPILCIAQTDDVEERIRFLEAGADDVMAKPFDDRELGARVDALLVRFAPGSTLAGDGQPGLTVADSGSRMIAVFSPKGGVGTTTIAVNIATALAGGRPDRIGLIDLDLQFGQVASHLNVIPRRTLTDLIRDEGLLRDPDALRSAAHRLASGVYLVSAPTTPVQAATVTRQHVETLLASAAKAWELVIVDAGHQLDERSAAVFEAASEIIVPVSPEFPALKAVRSLIDHLRVSQSIGGRTTFVLNSIFAREILRPADIEEALETHVDAQIPYDEFLFLKAVNEGVPIVEGAPRSKAAQALVRLARTVSGEIALPERPAEPETRPHRIAGLLRRS